LRQHATVIVTYTIDLGAGYASALDVTAGSATNAVALTAIP
jgi:hypothetical protein